MNKIETATFNAEAAAAHASSVNGEDALIAELHREIDAVDAPEPIDGGAQFQITPFDFARVVEHGNARATVRVRGYWSADPITVFLDRHQHYAGGGVLGEAEWTVTTSHSSGGRDSSEVQSDIEASINFGSALVAAALYGRAVIEKDAAALEAQYQLRLAERRAAHEAEVAAKQAEIDADRALGDRGAKALLDLAVATTKHSGVMTVLQIFSRGQKDSRMATVSLSRGGITQLNDYGSAQTRANFLLHLAKASHRTCIEQKPAA
jgi:hypothetical protein